MAEAGSPPLVAEVLRALGWVYLVACVVGSVQAARWTVIVMRATGTAELAGSLSTAAFLGVLFHGALVGALCIGFAGVTEDTAAMRSHLATLARR